MTIPLPAIILAVVAFAALVLVVFVLAHVLGVHEARIDHHAKCIEVTGKSILALNDKINKAHPPKP